VWDILVAGILDFVALDVCVAPSSVSRLSKKEKRENVSEKKVV
jgi:hypothetical protein